MNLGRIDSISILLCIIEGQRGDLGEFRFRHAGPKEYYIYIYIKEPRTLKEWAHFDTHKVEVEVQGAVVTPNGRHASIITIYNWSISISANSASSVKLVWGTCHSSPSLTLILIQFTLSHFNPSLSKWESHQSASTFIYSFI